MFSGIQPRNIACCDDAYYRGSPCLYHKHSGSNGSAYAWRDAKTHACLECVEEIKAGSFSFDLNELQPAAQSYAARFWNNVDIESWDDCWRWKGELSKTRHLFYMWPRKSISSTYKYHPIRVVNWITRGDIALSGVKSLCGERRCCNPLHQLPDFAESVEHPRDFLDMQRDQLLFQLVERSRPVFDVESVDPGLEFKYACAYDTALKDLGKKYVRQLVK